ncbi:MAG: HEAT repeat domain-containing protein [Candidatus Poribacteria bacterium]|nr:HEAT repeat domain-containing protein [Candidatus Poribacteria bacterium]
MNKRAFVACLYLVSIGSIASHAQLQDKDIASLIQQFNHPDADVQDSARQSLAKIGEAAVPVLIEALGDTNHKYRANVTATLMQIGMPAMPALIEALDHENVFARREAVGILCYFTLKTAPNHKKFKRIVRALVKAFKDDDYKVRHGAMMQFSGRKDPTRKDPAEELPPELATEVISGLVQALYYGSPFFDGYTASRTFIWFEDRGLAALTEALHSSSWPLRFGAAVVYGKAFATIHARRGMLQHHYIKPLPKAVVPILAEGLTHPDWRTQEDAASVLDDLDLRHCHICEHTEEAKKALEALPPFGIISQSIRDRDDAVDIIGRHKDSKCLDSLNADGITFKFNRSIRGWEKFTIRPFTEAHDSENRWKRVYGEPLDWNVEESSHSVNITPSKGEELVKGQRYEIQLSNFRDILGNRVDAIIEFSTIVSFKSSPHPR